MDGQAILALVLAIPVILFPAALVWHINVGGLVEAVRKMRAAHGARATIGGK